MSGSADDVMDLLEVMYRQGAEEFGRAALLPQVKFQFDHWPEDRFWNAVEEADQRKLVEIRRNGYAAFTFEGRRLIDAKMKPSPSITRNKVQIGTNINSPIQQGGSSVEPKPGD